MGNKYLNENNYKKGKNFLIIVATLILILGVGISGLMIYNGVTTTSSSNRLESDIKSDISKTSDQINKIDSEISSLEMEQRNVFGTEGFSGKYNEIENKIDSKTKEKEKLEEVLDNYEDELDEAQSLFGNLNLKGGNFKYIFVYIFAIFIMGASLLISLGLYKAAFAREILSYGTQTVMPVAQEGIEKMAPSIGKVAEEITKGINDGSNNDTNNN